MGNKSNIIFGQKINFQLSATPSSGSYLIGYDVNNGLLSQKDDNGIVTAIGVVATASALEKFVSDSLVSLSPGKSFGKYVNGDIIPSNGKTAVEVIKLSIMEEIAPTISLNSSTIILYNQTAIDNVLTFSYTINSIDPITILPAVVSSVLLEWRRNNTGSWTTLSTNVALTNYTHSYTDTPLNSQPFNYRYTVIDSLGGTNTITKDITPESYIEPSVLLNVNATSLTYPEIDLKRERGNFSSNISGLITRNNSLVDLQYYQLQYQKDNGIWTDFGATVSISGETYSIPSTNQNEPTLASANSVSYRVNVTDLKQTSQGSATTVNFLNLIFYGPSSSAPTISSEVRNLSDRILSDGSNPFILNTGMTDRFFNVVLPSTLSVTEVLDLDALNINYTLQYASSPISILDYIGTSTAYNLYTMPLAVPYSDQSHRHQIRRT